MLPCNDLACEPNQYQVVREAISTPTTALLNLLNHLAPLQITSKTSRTSYKPLRALDNPNITSRLRLQVSFIFKLFSSTISAMYGQNGRTHFTVVQRVYAKKMLINIAT